MGKFTLALGLRFFQGNYGTDWHYPHGCVTGGDVAGDLGLLLPVPVLSILSPGPMERSGMHDSPRLRFHPLSTGQAQWCEGFWGERFALCRDGALHAMEEILNTTPHGASLHNFPKAAGQQTGAHEGTKWSDGGTAALHHGTSQRPELFHARGSANGSLAASASRRSDVHEAYGLEGSK